MFRMHRWNRSATVAVAGLVALTGVGLPPRSRESVRGWVGNGTDRLVQHALAPSATRLQDEVLAAVKRAFEVSGGGATVPYAGVPTLLEGLRAQGMPLVQGIEDGGARKPAPEFVHAALARMELAADDAALVGDSEVDIETGRQGGVAVVAVSWGFRSRESLVAERPDFLIDDPSELPALLQRLGTNRAGAGP